MSYTKWTSNDHGETKKTGLLTCLNERHELVRANELSISKLREHILLNHGMSGAHLETQGDFGEYHLYLHAQHTRFTG